MNSTAKGSLAAAVAALLLTGGAGTLAYWSDTENVPGGPLSSGQLDLGTPACGAGWVLDGGLTLTPTTLIVPGDTLTKTCTINLIARGEHLGADLTIGNAAFAAPNGLTNELVPTATFTVNGATRNHVTDADDTGNNEIVATIGVTFNGPAATNASQNLTATLNTIAVTATQTHDVP